MNIETSLIVLIPLSTGLISVLVKCPVSRHIHPLHFQPGENDISMQCDFTIKCKIKVNPSGYFVLSAYGSPVKMELFCGTHLQCSTSPIINQSTLLTNDAFLKV